MNKRAVVSISQILILGVVAVSYAFDGKIKKLNRDLL